MAPISNITRYSSPGQKPPVAAAEPAVPKSKTAHQTPAAEPAFDRAAAKQAYQDGGAGVSGVAVGAGSGSGGMTSGLQALAGANTPL